MGLGDFCLVLASYAAGMLLRKFGFSFCVDELVWFWHKVLRLESMTDLVDK